MIALPGVTIQSQIHESAASLVYRGVRERDERAIVIKLLKQDYPSAQELTRYRQEYEITRSLNVEGVVRGYSQQDYQRTLAILLEDFGGESIERWMQQYPEAFCPIPLSHFFQLAINLTDTLGKIHAANIIHRDINPSNIVLNLETGVVKIIDFGIATRFNRTNPVFGSLHQIEGTLAYLSPEQTGRMNRWVDYRTDFYSLGVTFYELLTGQLPFPTTNVLELVHCHIAKQPVPPHELNPTIPKPVSNLILKLMAKNAEDRYQSAWGIKADLELCAQRFAQSDEIADIQLGLQDVSEQFQIPQKLYGREAEITTLLAAFDRVACPENSRVSNQQENTSRRVELMLVSGCAGIGKSALVQELYQPITEKRGYFIWGKFDQFQRNIPYSAIVDALRKLVQQLLGEPDEQVQQWRSRLIAAVGSNGQLMIDAIPEVEFIIGQQPPVAEVGATEAQNRFNRVFQQFIRVFCSKEHPLAIFLDDLQWIDSATLKLIELMLLDEQTCSLFLVGAYRENELSPVHPLTLSLEGLRKQGAIIQKVVLTPLTLEPLSQLIAETLHRNIDTARTLAKLVLYKTEGNPFFVNEFLKTLYAENCLIFDADRRNWQWNIAQIQARDITDNVVVLMTNKLGKLPESVQQILQLAACVGNEFDLDTLSMICEKPIRQIFSELAIAIQAGLILPNSEPDENLLIQNHKFLHDRVQQAAYALIDESQKQVVRLQIGHNLLEKMSPEELSTRLFEVVDHLNQGFELVTAESERTELARLNLMAAQKAKATTAYSAAQTYLSKGNTWLTVSSWQTHYQLTLDLYLETIETAYLRGLFEQVEYWTAIVIREARTILDVIKVYEVKIQTDIARNQPLIAIETALQVLRQLGIDFPQKPTQSDIQCELDAISRLLDGKSIEDLIHLPPMVDLDKLAAMQILSRITLATWISAPNLMPLLVAKQVSLSIQYGNALVSLFAYALYGTILCGTVGNIELGYQFGQLALKLLSESNHHSLRARTLFVVNISIIHWKKHEREKLQPLLEGYHSGLETGDLEFAAYCAQGYSNQTFFVGKELMEVEHNMATYSEAIRQIKQEVALTWIQIFQQTIANLMGSSVNPYRLVGKFFNEENGLSQHLANDGTAICCLYLSKLFLHYLLSDYARAVEYAAIGEGYLSYVAPTNISVMHCLYNSLARLATYSESSAQVQSEIFIKVASNQQKMKQWADYAPMNYLHKYYLVEAEKARVLGQFLEAEEFYEQAIQGAGDHAYLQEEALAYELAAKHYLERGRVKVAQTYIKEAHYCYGRWGATAKVKELESRYPQFFSQKVASTSTHTIAENTSDHSAIAFDLAAVMKASQAISCEIELEPLLRSLMQILIENAGAQTGYLILDNCKGEWLIEASCELSQNKPSENVCAIEVLRSLPATNQLPQSIVQYVIRTQESVILDDATLKGNFTHDPYIQQHQPQSICCLPLLNQAKLVGVLYLENQQAIGAFTPERSQILNFLSTQAAISLANARLYSKLQANESKITQFLEAIPVGIAIVDAAGRPYYANRQAIQLVGKESDPSVPLDQVAEIYQFYLAGTNQKYPTEKLATFRALNGERTRNEDMEIRRNQATIPVEVWGTPVFEQGSVTYALTAFHDITERKQAEKLLADYNRTLEQQVTERTAALQASEAALRDVYDKLRSQEQQLRLITDALPVLIGYTDTNQRYQFVNRAYEVWFCRSREEILGKTVHELLIEEAYHVAAPNVNQAQAGQINTFEAELPYPSGKKYISATLVPDFDDNGQVKGTAILVADISERKAAEAALQASETRLRTLISAIPDPLFVLTAEGKIVEAVAVEPDRLCKPIEEIIGKTLHQLGNTQADELLSYTQQVLRTQQILTAEYSEVLNGRETWFSTRIAPFRHDQVIWLTRDITALKQAEAASILDERNRMAREIHDTLAQAFTGILIQVGAATQVLGDDVEATQAHLETIEDLARLGLTEARRSVTALRPQLLEEGNLSSALDRLVAQLKSATDTTLIYEIQGVSYCLPAEVENNLLRIGQEALTNAIKYACASEIRIELVYEDAQCCLRVKDNGQGFAIVDAPPVGGFGLLGMSERAERIGAQLRIESQPEQGTEIVVIVDRGRTS
jgi:PAS domain S-box-containing protein